MTDEDVADQVYFEPLTVKNIEKIIEIEKPDGLLMSVSGQTGLNLAFDLDEQEIIKKHQIKILGTPIASIKQGEDREKFKSLMEEIDEPTPESSIVETEVSAIDFAKEVGYPIIIRPAYTLGGSGGGIAHDEPSFRKLIRRGLRASPIHQCLIEKSIAGWKEIEFEVIRDHLGVTKIICHMENIDPVGIHTGDSIVVAPIQTLSKKEIDKLKEASKHIVNALGIIGACNVQLAYEPNSKQYVVIEVNPRVSRSSALASKATGYPIAKIATKLSIGYTLEEIYFEKLNQNLAQYEPELDYTVVKFPCFPFDKLKTADRTLGTQMKATGEVMAIEKTMSGALQKALRSLSLDLEGFTLKSFKTYTNEALKQVMKQADDRRLFAIFELLKRNVSIFEVHQETKIDIHFLNIFHQLIEQENLIEQLSLEKVTNKQLFMFKQAGFTNKILAEKWSTSTEEIKALLDKAKVYYTYESVQAFSEKETEEAQYYYAVYKQGNNKLVSKKDKKVLVIGSGPIKIGQGIEFDYCSVQGVKALQKLGYKTVLINNNPATVSTDYEIADKLYFEPITAEDVLKVMEFEQIEDVIIQFGGQTAINLVADLEASGVQFFGSSQKTIDTLEDRESFYSYLQSIDVPHIPGEIAEHELDLKEKIKAFGYPVLVRPSYVIGGQGMVILQNDAELKQYLKTVDPENAYPILIDAYYPGYEVEIDAVTDGKHVFIPTIFEHIEKAGVHSGDSMAITPPITLSEKHKKDIVNYTEKIAKNIPFKGIFNIQFVIYENELYVLEVNPRASRTVPVTSKVKGVNLIEMAVQTLIGNKFSFEQSLVENDFYTIKAPVFSTNKLPGVDPILVPEMKSTGELIGLANNYEEAVQKAFVWSEQLEREHIYRKEIYVPSSLENFEELKNKFIQSQYKLIADEDFAGEATYEKLENWMRKKEAYAIFNTAPSGKIRQRALELNVHVFSSLETLLLLLETKDVEKNVQSIQQYKKAYDEKEVTYT